MISLKSLIFILLAVVFVLPGCGKKGPPVPPRQKAIPAVNDLTYGIDGTTLTLTWTVPPKKEKVKTDPDGFMVYRYKRPLSDSACKNCPKLFERVSDIPLNMQIDKPGYKHKNMEYREEIEKGFLYTYKVIFYTKNGGSSTDSNYVEFSF